MSRSSRHLDNRTARSERSPFMARDDMERMLRDSLSRQVADPVPLAVDPAGLAIRRGRAVQRRRTMAGLALAAVATAGVSAAVAQLGEAPGQTPAQIVVIGDPPASPGPTGPTGAPPPVVPSSAGDRPPVDLVVGTWLRTPTGKLIDLAAVGRVERAQRISGGWLVTGEPAADGRTLWFVDQTNPPQVVLAGVESVALAPDGRQVAWRDGADLFAAGVIGGKAIAAVRTPLPERATPVGFVGDAVLVRRTPVGEPGGYALWWPGRGSFRAGWNTDTLAVYGVLPDGRAVGQVSTGTPRRACLALLDPDRGLAPLRTACNVALASDGTGLLSPDGRWLVANGEPPRAGSATGAALVVDLTRAFDGTPAPAPKPAGPPLVSGGGWSDPTTLLHVGRDGALIRVPVPAVAAERRTVAGGQRDRVSADVATRR